VRLLYYHGVEIRLRRAFCLLLICLGCLGAQIAAADAPLRSNDDGTLEFQVKKPSRTLVIFLSGDGGLWGDLDVQLAQRMVQEGYAVVGVDTRKWFSVERQPIEIAAHLADLLRQYVPLTHAKRVVLAGYSFGADAVPVAYNRLAPEWRKQIAALLLLIPSRTTMFEVTLAERTGLITGDYNLAPEYAHLPGNSVICIYGLDEATYAGCTLPQLTGADVIALNGGHHFENDAKALGDRVTVALKAKGLP